MDVHEAKRNYKRNLKKRKKIYNPDLEDFTVKYADKAYTIKANELQEYPLFIANHIQKHLATHIANKRGIKVNPDYDLVKINKEIEEFNIW